MAIRSITDAQTAAASSASASTGTNNNLGKDQFLHLLVTQMQYQDPLNPMDNAQFTAQLAQFSSLEQLFQVNDNLTGLADSQTPAGMASIAGFIDREILATGDSTEVGTSGATPLQFYLDGPAEIVNAVIQAPDGTLVRNMALGPQPGGDREIGWDGLDDNGLPLDPGTYRFAVVAQDQAGSSVEARTQVQGVVSGAVYDGTSPQLVVGTRRIPLADVLAVKDPAPASTGN
jgi:flagellar basal-body rod modification protein FlgD